MRVIAITGMPGSGKGEIVNIAKSVGYPVVRMGDAVWEKVRELGLELNDTNVGKIATEEREKNGRNIWAVRTAEKIKNLDTEVVFIDGVRSMYEVETFKKEFGEDFLIISVLANRKTRLMRLLKRGREDDVYDEESFAKRDEREKSWGIEEVINEANLSIINEIPLEDFRKYISDLLKRIV